MQVRTLRSLPKMSTSVCLERYLPTGQAHLAINVHRGPALRRALFQTHVVDPEVNGPGMIDDESDQEAAGGAFWLGGLHRGERH